MNAKDLASAIRTLPNAGRFLQALKEMDPDHQQQVAEALMAKQQQAASQKTSLWNIYYSEVRFTPTYAGGVATLAKGTELNAFSYKIGDDLTSGQIGFPTSAGNNAATAANTNLITAGQTVAGNQVIVYGISVQFSNDTDALMAKMVADYCSVTLSMNGDNQLYRLGRLAFIPGSGGLYGGANTLHLLPPAQEAIQRDPGSLSNGIPSVANFLPFPEPLIWNPAGGNDSTFIIRFRVERPINITEPANRAAVAGGASTSGTAAYTAPTTAVVPGTGPSDGVGLIVRLHSQQVSPRSVNV